MIELYIKKGGHEMMGLKQMSTDDTEKRIQRKCVLIIFYIVHYDWGKFNGRDAKCVAP